MTAIPIIGAVLTTCVLFKLLFKLFFESADDFWSALGYTLKPDFISWLSGDLQKDYGQSLKFGLYSLCTFGPGVGAFYLIGSLMSK